MNKNISIWRGSDPPPTNYHIWVKSDNSINLFIKDEWKIITDPEAYENLVKYIDEQINLLKSGADIDFDTLKEIADWIKQHEEDYMLVLPQLQSQLEVLQSNINKKLDLIEDLDTIRKGAEKGTTSIQEIKTINGQSLVGPGNINIEDHLKNTVTLSTDLTIAGAKIFTQKVTAPSFIVPSGTADQFLKADGSLDNKVYLNTENYKSYVPSLTGEGATGTWNININGNASSVEWNNVTLRPTKLSEFTDDVVEGNYLPMAESTYDTADTINVLKHDGSWGIPEFSSNLYGLGESSSQTAIMQPTAGELSIDDGIATVNSVKGNTIVWNQLIYKFPTQWYKTSNAISVEFTDNLAKLTIVDLELMYVNGEGIYCTPIQKSLANHKYLIKCKARASSDGLSIRVRNFTKAFPITVQYSITSIATEWQTISYIDYDIKDYQGYIMCDVTPTNIKNGDTIEFKNVQVFDLTQMFGEGNEPTIEEFEAMFPNDYYEYNEGELKSIEDFSIKSVGFNQWDEEWESGFISSNGELIPNTNSIRSANYIKTIPNTNYYISTNNPSVYIAESIRIKYYDINKNFISVSNIYSPNLKFTIPNNCYYIKWCTHSNILSITNYTKGDICINLSHSGIRDGEYEPYQEDILPISISTIKDENGDVLFPNGLCSAGEAHDELVYDKGISKWKAVKRIGSVDLGSLNWYTGWYTDGGIIYVDLISKAVGAMNIIYPLGLTAANDNKLINSVGICGNAKNTFIFIGQGATHTDSAAFIASLNGIYAYYELAEPIEVVLDDVNLFYKAWDWGTEERVSDKMLIPFTMDITYNPNVVKLIKSLQLTITMIQLDLQNVNNLIQTAILSAITTTLNTNI